VSKPGEALIRDGDVIRSEVVVVGSGAGGAATAVALTEHGYDVLVLEEGPNIDMSRMSSNSPEAIATVYRNGGMTPILGNQTIAYVEGRCVGGSTEINSGFWHRLQPEAYDRWRAEMQVEDLNAGDMAKYFERLERDLSVSLSNDQAERTSAVLREGAERLSWDCVEVPRCLDPGGSPFAPGAKRSMQRTYIPRAIASGARLLPDCKAVRILHENGRARGVRAKVGREGAGARVTIEADAVFVCCGPVQTPALLRSSGIKRNVGDNLRIHPMIKVAARFDEPLGEKDRVVPVYQVKEFWPTLTIGGSVFTPGFLAMILAENWPMGRGAMTDWSRMGIYYAATRGMSRGTVRVLPGLEDGVVVRYRLSEADQRNINVGLAHLGELLFASGARAIYPSLAGFPVLTSVDQCRAFLKRGAPVAAMGLSTVHAFSSCPMGENPDVCATDSFGRVRGFANLFVCDASLLPDSPGVNPQGTTMAIALRNADHVAAGRQKSRARAPRAAGGGSPPVLVTGSPGWLGTRFVETLVTTATAPGAAAVCDAETQVHCLVQRDADPTILERLDERVVVQEGDLTDGGSLRQFTRAAAGGLLVHIAGVVHPRRWTRDFERINVDGTRRLLEAAEEAGVRRAVVVSSNSPIGCNAHPEDLFDETSPYNPYMGYGRSKARMEAVVREVHGRGRLETVIIRPPWFYGPHQPARQTLFFSMIKNGKFPILGDGQQRRSMAYVDNICQGILLAAVAPGANGEVYWIADARPYTMNEIVDTVEDVLERDFGIRCSHRRLRLPAFVGTGARIADAALQALGLYHQKIHVLGEMQQTIACSIDKARRELGYEPRFALRDGMHASIRWCLDNGLWI
jgi:nucleoside-diphosphate-sugar epimerase/choline dehydrogenase-like flavoprotein